MATIRGLVGTQQLEAGIQVIDCRDMIFSLNDDESPFFQILEKVDKESKHNQEFHWFEDDFLGNYTQINNGSNHAAGDTTLIVDDAGIIHVNDVLKNTRTWECVLVTGVDDTNNKVYVKRGWGTTSAAQMNDNDYLYKMTSAMQEGHTAPESLITQKTKVTNYLQTFSRTVTVTEQQDSTKTYGGKRRMKERNKVGKELRRDIEAQMIWGEPKVDTSGNQVRYQTGGLYYFLKNAGAPSLDMNNARLTETAWKGILADIFQTGSPKRFFGAGTHVLSQISDWPSAKQRMEPGRKIKYGVSVSVYHDQNGEIYLLHDKHFDGPWAGNGIFFEPEQLTYAYLENMDLKLAMDIQTKKEHFMQDEYFGTLGLEFHNPLRGGYIENIDVS